jgi:hypothetical protein
MILHSYAILTALLFVSFGFTSAFADDSYFVNSQWSFEDPASEKITSQPLDLFNAITGQPPNVDTTQVQLAMVDGQVHYVLPDTLDENASLAAILVLGIPFGILVYRMSDTDPIPLKYAKLSAVAIFFATFSMLTMPIAIGNNYWGYAMASEEPEVNIPKPVNSIYFDFTSNLSDEVNIVQDKKNSAILIDEQNYLVVDSNLDEKLEQFTVSTWVKPDYKAGSSETLSIVSEADAFDLSINNNKMDKNVAVFSVYDGIKWHNVESKSAIPENWTHISATFSNNNIKIFVNGIQENSQKIDGDYSLTYQYGVATQNSFDYISAKSDLVIGAFNPSVRETSTFQNNFSGLIDDVTIYDKLLSSEQISSLDEQERTPDAPPVKEFHTSETKYEKTGTENEYGFVTDDDNPSDQKIEEVAAEGYKVKKPEEKKKKDKVVAETPETEANEEAETILEFDESTILSTENKTEVCHIPPGNPSKAKVISIDEADLQDHLDHEDHQDTMNCTVEFTVDQSKGRQAP